MLDHILLLILVRNYTLKVVSNRKKKPPKYNKRVTIEALLCKKVRCWYVRVFTSVMSRSGCYNWVWDIEAELLNSAVGAASAPAEWG